MYSSKIVCAVKVNGLVLREVGDTVRLPFGSEYSILIKNLDSVRLSTSIAVDGQEAISGRLIIEPNSSIELERTIRSLESGNRFKFIERTKEIEQHRGISADDGLIRVESWKERMIRSEPAPLMDRRRVVPPRPDHGPRKRSQIQAKSGRLRGPGHPTARGSLGITVPGSLSSQRFYPTSGFPLEQQSIVIVIRLVGCLDGEPVAEPLTVDYRPECQTCGKRADQPDAEFCDRCGTSLVIVA